MTSASELFIRRRSRVDRNDTPPELGFGSSSSSSSSSLDRNLHLHQHRRCRRHHHHQRRDVEDCDPVRRSQYSRHLCHREQEPVRLDYGVSQSGTGSSSRRGTSSSRVNRLQIARSDQLPGAVLLARERLVERLRGVSLTGNRQGGRIALSNSWGEFAYTDDLSLVDTGDWEIETSGEWASGVTPLTDSSTQTDIIPSLHDFSKKRPPGLSRETAKCLQREVFNLNVKTDELVLLAVVECSICLDRFEDGEGLTCLPCGHKFHSSCLDPWVRTCGDCPNCRTGQVNSNSLAVWIPTRTAL